MAIVEILTVELGASIAKSILKLWLKDNVIASDVASDLLGLIKGKTKDVIAQLRAKRQFEAIGERVAENLLPLFEAEKSKFDEASQTAVALQISTILNNSKIDSSLLAEEDLEPSKLLLYLQNLHPARSRDFSKEEAEFFERILSEVCQNIVDIASQLPAFTERTLSEILKRENELIKKADTLLEEVKRIRQSSERFDATAQSTLFETEYRRAIVRKLDELELFGADVSRASRRHRLSVAYVTLSVEEITAHGEEKNEENEESDQPTEQSTTVAVDKIVLEHPRLFIRGDAGSGKTTLLQWIAVRAASGTFEGSLSILNEYTPFFIRLRQCSERGLPPPQDFPELIVPSIAGTMPTGWVHERLRSGKAIVLIDGLDEVSKLKREEVREWLRELVSNFSDARYVLSSRPPAANEGWLAPEGFQDAMMQPMTLEDIFDFIDHWHQAVQDVLEDQAEKDEIGQLADSLKSVIQNNRPIHNLATTPLLCAMIAALHRDRRRQLPKDRIELYEACTYMLLERREIERQIDYSDYPSLTYRQKKVFLQGFAYWLMKNGRSSSDIERLDNHFDSKLQNFEGSAKYSGKDIRRLFVERSGMLREPIKGIVHFAHRTFQEFLAAHAVLDEDDIGVLIKNAHDDQWREVVILASGLASQKTREDLIGKLIERGDADVKRRYQLHLLAVACLETSILLSPEVKREIETRLKRLTPPKTMTEAKEWASAGELAIPYLATGANKRAVVAAACVRALALIGGELSLQTLERFSSDNRQTVLSELLRGQEFFDLEEYARIILSKNEAFAPHFSRVSSLRGLRYLKYLTHLAINPRVLVHWSDVNPMTGPNFQQTFRKISTLTDLLPLASLENLQFLTVSDCSELNSLEPLRGLTALKELRLSYINNRTDLSPIGDLSNLKRLTLRGDITDLSGLTNLVSIKYLELDTCKTLTNLHPLTSLTSLEVLRIRKCPQVTDLSPLANLSNLHTLSLQQCNGIVDISYLSALRELEILDLSECEQISALSGLEYLEKLKSLTLSKCKNLVNFSSLKNIATLFRLSLIGCEHIENLEFLSQCFNLKYLNLAGCKKIVDLKPISSLQSLEVLSLGLCESIENIEPLAHLTHLRVLDLGLCEALDNFRTLQKLKSLMVLSLFGNHRVKSLDLEMYCKGIAAINISGCRNINVDSLIKTNEIESLRRFIIGAYSRSDPRFVDPSRLVLMNPKGMRTLLMRLIHEKDYFHYNVRFFVMMDRFARKSAPGEHVFQQPLYGLTEDLSSLVQYADEDDIPF